jgi:protein ImuA
MNMEPLGKEQMLAQLRRQIARIEGSDGGRLVTVTMAGDGVPACVDPGAAPAIDMGRDPGPASGAVPLGVAEIDRRLPGRGLQRGRLHEVVGAIEGAGTGFVVLALRRLLAWDGRRGAGGPVLWCAPRGSLYAPGLAARGLDVDRLVMVVAPRREDRLWAMEESLRVPGVLAVIGELQGREAVDLTASRRLQLAAGHGGAMALLLRPAPPEMSPAGREFEAPEDDGEGEGDKAEAGLVLGASAAVTRWLVQTLPSARDEGEDDMGRRSRWRLALTRSRTGARHRWTVEVDHATGDLALAPSLRDRSGAPRRAVA